MGAALPYDSLPQLRQALVERCRIWRAIDEVPENAWQPEGGQAGRGPISPCDRDFYLTNPIARASELMAELSANAKARPNNPMAAE
jgi:NADH-quinone oxidoreductase subunit G